jgi:hypothetical protein
MTPVTCDFSMATARPFMTPEFRRTAFNTVHRLSHPGVRATVRLVTQCFVWPAIKADCRKWARACLECQRSKVFQHVSSPVGSFAPPSARFEHVHIDLVVLPPCEVTRYCLTMVDRFPRWPKAVPLPNQEEPTVDRAFLETWISRFGVPLRVTTDQGRQFESFLFRNLNILTGTTHPHHGVPLRSQRYCRTVPPSGEGSHPLPPSPLDGSSPPRPPWHPFRLEGGPWCHSRRHGLRTAPAPSRLVLNTPNSRRR